MPLFNLQTWPALVILNVLMLLRNHIFPTERIAKSLTEGHKFQESILINSSLTAVGKVQKQLIN